jgi:hypothetical protein
VVFWKSAWWQSKQIVDVPVKRLFTWHCMHGTAAWAPVSGKADVAWLNVAGVQAMVVWQDLHSVENPPATCAGFVVFWKSAWWQSKQIVDVPVKRLFT